MPGQVPKEVSERKAMQQDTRILLKLAELLLQDQLISQEEKFRLAQLIREDHAL